MSDHWLNSTPSLHPFPQARRNFVPSPLANMNIDLSSVIVPAVTKVNKRLPDRLRTHPLRLLQNLLQSLPIVGIAPVRHRTQNPSPSARDRHAHLTTKLVSLVCLTLALNVSNHLLQPCPHPPRAPLRPLHLTRVCVTVVLQHGIGQQTVVVLVQLHSSLLRSFQQSLPHPVGQPHISRKTNRLLLNCRLYIDPLNLTELDQPAPHPDLNCLPQQLLCTLLPYPLPPSRHARRIDRQLMLKIVHLTKILPIRILHPQRQYIPIAHLKCRLQLMPTHHQPPTYPGTTLLSMIPLSKHLVEMIPVDPVR